MSENVEKSTLEQYEEIVQELGLEIKSKFVPFSISINANEEHKTLNWKVTIKSSKNSITIDFNKGVGHLPYPSTQYVNGYQRRMINEAIESAIETGIARKLTLVDKDVKFSPGNAEFPTPTLQEVLYCLTSESDVKNYLTYEQWAGDFGYDVDSRKGEKVYEQCRQQTADFMKLIGSESKLDKLRELLFELDNECVTAPSKPKM